MKTLKGAFSCFMCLVIFTVCVPVLTLAAAPVADIGCYEYGYESADEIEVTPEYADPALYGENCGVVYYVSPSGSDSTGSGAEASPWQTPSYAASRAQSGSIIRLAAGTYSLTSPVLLPVGVSLEGAGVSTVLTSSSLTQETAGANALVRLVSALGTGGAKTDGNQHISNIKFDGGSVATQAIEIQNRNNVAVHDCTVVSFAHVGVGWRSTDVGGVSNSDDPAPAIDYVTGGRFYNNYMKDNALYGADSWGNVYARGSLFCGGLL